MKRRMFPVNNLIECRCIPPIRQKRAEWMGHGCFPGGVIGHRFIAGRKTTRRVTLLLMMTAGIVALTACSPPRPNHPVIGAKNFTEQVVLGELLAQEIEAKSGLKVERRFYLAGSYICQ